MDLWIYGCFLILPMILWLDLWAVFDGFADGFDVIADGFAEGLHMDGK